MADNCQQLLDGVASITASGSDVLGDLFDSYIQASPIKLPPSHVPDTHSGTENATSSVSSTSFVSTLSSAVPNIEEDTSTGDDAVVNVLTQKERMSAAVIFYDMIRHENSEDLANLSVRAIARMYDIPRTTFRRRIAGERSISDFAEEREKFLISEQLSLVSYVNFLFQIGNPATINRLVDIGGEILQRRYAQNLGVNVRSLDRQVLPEEYRCNDQTMRRLVARRTELIPMLAKQLGSKRAAQTNRAVAEDFQRKLIGVVKKFNIHDMNIWNMDETGFMLGGCLESKTARVIVPARDKKVNAIVTTSDNREWISVVEAISATGEEVPPYFIMKGQGKNVLSRIARKCDSLFDEWSYGISPNGWTDDEHAVQWLMYFERKTRPAAWDPTAWGDRLQDDGSYVRMRNNQLVWANNIEPDSYRLLILDGHGSHLTGAFITYALDHKIVILQLPPHTSHFLQPLDVGVFAQMKKRYRTHVQKRANVGRHNITKDEFLEIYAQIRPQNFSFQAISNGWAQTGIRPVSMQPLERHFMNAPVNDLQRMLQTKQQQLEEGTARKDKGLTVELTGLKTINPADKLELNKLFKGQGRYLSVDPNASFHQVCDQILVEQDPQRRALLVEACRAWCDRKEIETKIYKIAGNLFYEAAVQNKKAVAESSSRAHLGLGRVVDEEAWAAHLEREAEAQAEATHTALEKQYQKCARQAASLGKKKLAVQEKAAKAKAKAEVEAAKAVQSPARSASAKKAASQAKNPLLDLPSLPSPLKTSFSRPRSPAKSASKPEALIKPTRRRAIRVVQRPPLPAPRAKSPSPSPEPTVLGRGMRRRKDTQKMKESDLLSPNKRRNK